MMRDLNSVTAAHDAVAAPNFDRLIAKSRKAAPTAVQKPEKLPAKVYAVMALTTVLTFAALDACYELFFVRQIVA